MRTDQYFRCLFHLFKIQRHINKIAVFFQDRISEFCMIDTVFICFPCFYLTRMKILCHFFGLLNADVLWQSLVQRIRDLLCRYSGIGGKHSEITECMHACICSAGTDNCDLLSQKLTQMLIQLSFYRIRIWLHLPATVCAAIICNRQHHSLHTPDHSLSYSIPIDIVLPSKIIPAR